MAFDGVDWSAPALVHARAHHPKAPLTNEALQGALISTYYAGRHNAVRLHEQTFGRNRISAVEGSDDLLQQTGAWAEVSSGYAWCSSLFTHLRMISVYRVASLSDTEVHHRIKHTEAGGTKTGDDIARPITANATLDLSLPGVGIQIASDAAGDYAMAGTFTAQAEVALTGQTLDSDALITVEAYATGIAVYRPLWVAVFGEVRR